MRTIDRLFCSGTVLLLIFLTPFNQALTQPLLKQGTPPLATPFTEINGNLSIGDGKVGIGISAPIARLHLRSITGLSTQPLQELNIYSGMNHVGSIRHFVTIEGQNYGIYQNSNSDAGILNYYQDPVKIGNITISKEGTSASRIASDQWVSTINFVMNSTSGPTTTPLAISGNGIRVRSNLITDEFQMVSGAGQNKILMSDDVGNARWTDPTSMTVSPWIVTSNKDVVRNRDCRFVGIGTESPTQPLEVCPTEPAGGISINQLTEGEFGSEIVFKKQSEPQFSIGHIYSEHRPSFILWSHKAETNGTLLYMDLRNGMTGIGTAWPCALLDVAGDLRVQTKLGVGCIPPVDPHGLYKLYVEGGIKARDIKVTNMAFPDYCFEDDYPLMSLQDLRTYINENKHLPGIPSAKEIKRDQGFEIGAMQTKLLEKVEEQALYILDLQNQITELKLQVESMINK